MKRAGVLLAAALIAQCLFSCRYDKAEQDIPCAPPDSVSFSGNILPLLNEHCNTAGCHSGSAPAGNLDLSPAVAYAELLDPSGGYVDTLHPEYSLFYTQLRSVSNPMPPSGKLDDCSIALVRKWIEQKAKNN